MHGTEFLLFEGENSTAVGCCHLQFRLPHNAPTKVFTQNEAAYFPAIYSFAKPDAFLGSLSAK